MKSPQSHSSSSTTSSWEEGLVRSILPVEGVTLEEIPLSEAAQLQDEAVTRTVSILRDKLSRGSSSTPFET